jgi:sterol 3beta-glucosyltransferase
MNITLLTYGSEGDVEPFVVLGKGLVDAGHQVTLAAPETYQARAAGTKINYVSFPGDPRRLVQELVENAGNQWWRMVSAMTDFVIPLAKDVFSLSSEACQGADLVIHSFLMTNSGYEIARELNVPDISLQTFPVFTSTKEFPAPAAPDLPLGRTYRLLTHQLVTQTFWQGSRLIYIRVKKDHPQLPPLSVWPFREKNDWQTPILYAFSPSVVPRPGDWRPEVHITGYLFEQDITRWSPDTDLVRFVNNGTPPIAIAFGSTQSKRFQALINKLKRVIIDSDQRAIFAGSDGLEIESDPRIFKTSYIPYDWLFERSSAVIHHGGAGTTGKALRAGIPSIILPFTSDQPFWGRQIQKLGLGPAPLSPRNVSLKQLTTAIDLVLSDQEIRNRAGRIGQSIKKENGVTSAVDLIERYGSQKR